METFSELVLEFILKTNNSVFLTGKAGTGKTTLLHEIKAAISRNLVVVAPTAVAAINAGGATMHSFFQIPFGPLVPKTRDIKYVSKLGIEKQRILKTLEILVIDEISMVRADTIDYIDEVLRQERNSFKPFGGVQVIMIGDLYQLPPIVHAEWPVLKEFYSGPYFFDSHVYPNWPVTVFEMKNVFRQKDPLFLEILNSIRIGQISGELLQELNHQYRPILTYSDTSEHITLSTHNHRVNEINNRMLDELPGDKLIFKASIAGDFPIDSYPADENLVMKVGAKILFLKNDTSGKKQFYNGRIGRITAVGRGSIWITCVEDEPEFEIVPETWQNVKYRYSQSDGAVKEENTGSFTQYPIKLAWAITIHRSQGLTFEKAIIDIDAAFSPGHAYVALSRCRNLEGLILKFAIKQQNIQTDPRVANFMGSVTGTEPDRLLIEQSVIEFDFAVLNDIFDFRFLTQTFTKLESMARAVVSENSSVLVELEKAGLLLNSDIHTIAERFFQKEVIFLPKNISPWSHVEFTKRLKNAVNYFTAKLLDVIMAVIDIVESEKQFSADFYIVLNQFIIGLTEKKAVFISSINAASSHDILRSKQNVSLTYQPIVPLIEGIEIPFKKQKNPELYLQLVSWRHELSKSRNVPDYSLIPEKVLREIATKVPGTMQLLARIKGMDDLKMVDLGEGILGILRSFNIGKDLFS